MGSVCNQIKLLWKLNFLLITVPAKKFWRFDFSSIFDDFQDGLKRENQLRSLQEIQLSKNPAICVTFWWRFLSSKLSFPMRLTSVNIDVSIFDFSFFLFRVLRADGARLTFMSYIVLFCLDAKYDTIAKDRVKKNQLR